MAAIAANALDFLHDNPLLGGLLALTLPVYGAVRWLLIKRKRLRWTGLLREALLLCFALYCAALLAVTFSPFELTLSAPDFSFRSRLLEMLLGTYTTGAWGWTMWLSNLALFFPFGLLTLLLWARKPWQALLLALGVILCVEVLQPFAGRSFDVDDLFLNFLGAAIGVGIGTALRALAPKIGQKLRA